MDKSQHVEHQNVIERVYQKLPYLNPALRRIADYILEYPDQCKTMTIQQLATACDVAESTVTRFVKEMDLNGYQELKIAIAEALSLNDGSDVPIEEKYVYEDIARTDSNQTIVDKVVYRNIQTLTDTKQRLNISELSKAVETIEQANVIIFCCTGSSGVAALGSATPVVPSRWSKP